MVFEHQHKPSSETKPLSKWKNSQSLFPKDDSKQIQIAVANVSQNVSMHLVQSNSGIYGLSYEGLTIYLAVFPHVASGGDQVPT